MPRGAEGTRAGSTARPIGNPFARSAVSFGATPMPCRVLVRREPDAQNRIRMCELSHSSWGHAVTPILRFDFARNKPSGATSSLLFCHACKRSLRSERSSFVPSRGRPEVQSIASVLCAFCAHRCRIARIDTADGRFISRGYTCFELKARRENLLLQRSIQGRARIAPFRPHLNCVGRCRGSSLGPAARV